MVSPPDVASASSAQGAQAGAAASGRASVQVTGPFNFYGVANAEDAAARIEEVMTRILEGDALQAAGAPA